MPGKDPAIHRNRRARLLQYYRHQKNCSLDFVQKIADLQTTEAEKASAQDILIVLVLWMSEKPIDATIELLDRFHNSTWRNKFDDEFFVLLERNADELLHAGFDQDTANLIKMGQVIAEMTNAKTWSDHFQEQIRQNAWAHIREQPYWKQRAW